MQEPSIRTEIHAEHFAAIKALLPAAEVVLAEEGRRVYESDGLTAFRQLPGCVVIVNNIQEVCQLLRYCATHRIPVVPRGAGTSLSGGALPIKDGVLLSLARMNQILAVDANRRLIRVQPGVTNHAISEHVAPLGLFYAPDPSSQIACTIGGNIAENAGGIHCLKYGLTVNNVTAVKLVDSSGELLEIGSEAMDMPGYDLLALLHGSEGLLGVVVEATLQLLPRPACRRVVLAAFQSIEQAGEAVAAILSGDFTPAGLEMMDRACVAAVEEFVHAGYPLEAEAILICELDGEVLAVEEQLQQLMEILQRQELVTVQVAENDAEGERFWAGRKAAFPAAGRISPDYYCMDGTIPRRQIAQVLQQISQLSVAYGLQVVNVFHAGDGNLHPLILYDMSQPGQLQRAEEMGSRILELCIESGGTITGEHGVGVEKLREMCVQFSAEELEQMLAVRRAFDMYGILNPDKAIPALSRCAEFGAMHVHNGKLPFAELERF